MIISFIVHLSLHYFANINVNGFFNNVGALKYHYSMHFSRGAGDGKKEPPKGEKGDEEEEEEEDDESGEKNPKKDDGKGGKKKGKKGSAGGKGKKRRWTKKKVVRKGGSGGAHGGSKGKWRKEVRNRMYKRRGEKPRYETLLKNFMGNGL